MIDLAFQKLVSDYKSKVFHTCLGFVHVPEDAEDLTQEVFIEVYKHWEEHRNKSLKSTWMYRIAVNKCLEWIRAQNRMKRKGLSTDIELVTNHLGDVNDPASILQQKQGINMILQLIRQLPEQQQIALTLHKIDGLSHEEIGKIMDKSKSSVESLIHRAKQKLMVQLKKQDNEIIL